MRNFSVALFLSSLFLCAVCFAQENPPAAQPPTQTAPAAQPASKTRPHIGVALEGGGALGFAHIGVLKWFEEQHIPVDYIAGTSMGGLVGGLYATGKSADELKKDVQAANWPLLLGGGTPYQDLTFRRKEDARAVPNTIQIGLKNGPTLPAGLNTGHQLNLLIDRYTLAYSELSSFNDLPIPFRCVSTELVSGKPYIFQDGSLSDALRATVSIPGVFAPVRHGDQVFVDGGLVDNLPTDVARSMGADVVIAIHLQISKTAAKEIQSAFSVLERSVSLVIAETEIRGMAGADLIVRVNLEDYTTTDYEKADALVQRGYDAAAAKALILKTYALSDPDWAEYQRQIQSRRRTTIGTPQFVRVEGTSPENDKHIQNFLRLFLGKPISTPLLDEYLTRLTGLGRFDSVTYGMVRENGQDGLLVRVHEKTYAPPLLQPSFSLDGSEPDDVTFTLGSRFTFMDVAGERSEWRTDLQFGATYGIATELYRPFLPPSHWFFAPNFSASQNTFLVYRKHDPLADYRQDRVASGIDLGFSFNRFSELRVGYSVGYSDSYLRLGAPEFAPISGGVAALKVRFILDHTNDPVIPTKGYYIQSLFHFYNDYPGATENFPTLQVTLNGFQPVSSQGSLFLTASGGTTFGFRQIGSPPPFFLGGPNQLSAYGLNELFGNQYFFARGGYLHKVFTLPTFVGRQVYLAGAGEFGKIYGDPNPVPRFSADIVGGFIGETAFGPVFVGGSIGDSGHYKWFFQLGRVF
ncbi:MAG TPA: patatin-like phospholipase family protein [Candidatus Acidoferrum sp.]|nr:patatin-like phospholipase family protein [Candidatus Acidoferrum sp.]